MSTMETIGVLVHNGRKLVIQRLGKQIYVSSDPVEQFPRELKDLVIGMVNSSDASTSPRMPRGASSEETPRQTLLPG